MSIENLPSSQLCKVKLDQRPDRAECNKGQHGILQPVFVAGKKEAGREGTKGTEATARSIAKRKRTRSAEKAKAATSIPQNIGEIEKEKGSGCSSFIQSKTVFKRSNSTRRPFHKTTRLKKRKFQSSIIDSSGIRTIHRPSTCLLFISLSFLSSHLQFIIQRPIQSIGHCQ